MNAAKLITFTIGAVIFIALAVPYRLDWPPFAGPWDGSVYLDRDNLTKDIYIGKFWSLDGCRTAAELELLRRRSSLERGDYECGLLCRANEFGTKTCFDTLR